jgi:DNA-binding response OmpR family regulator
MVRRIMPMTRLASILLVDDEVEILDAITEHLEREGYAVTRALDGEMALRKVQNERPDLVLLDVGLPGLSGFDVLQRLREDHPRVPVVMLTGLDDEAQARRMLELGAVDYIRKPFDLGHLSRVVLAAIGRTFEPPMSPG